MRTLFLENNKIISKNIFKGLCYAEFGARVPRCGSAYVYIYVTMGEFIAFVLGWDLVFECLIGVTAAATSTSSYLNSLADDKIFAAFRAAMPMNVEYFAPFPDFLSFGLVMIITCNSNSSQLNL